MGWNEFAFPNFRFKGLPLLACLSYGFGMFERHTAPPALSAHLGVIHPVALPESAYPAVPAIEHLVERVGYAFPRVFAYHDARGAQIKNEMRFSLVPR